MFSLHMQVVLLQANQICSKIEKSLAFGYGWPLFFPPKTDGRGYMGKPISARLIMTVTTSKILTRITNSKIHHFITSITTVEYGNTMLKVACRSCLMQS